MATIKFYLKSGESLTFYSNDDHTFTISLRDSLTYGYNAVELVNRSSKIVLKDYWMNNLKKFNIDEFTSAEIIFNDEQVFETSSILELNYSLNFDAIITETIQIKFNPRG